jgi:hypothetical protein
MKSSKSDIPRLQIARHPRDNRPAMPYTTPERTAHAPLIERIATQSIQSNIRSYAPPLQTSPQIHHHENEKFKFNQSRSAARIRRPAG